MGSATSRRTVTPAPARTTLRRRGPDVSPTAAATAPAGTPRRSGGEGRSPAQPATGPGAGRQPGPAAGADRRARPAAASAAGAADTAARCPPGRPGRAWWCRSSPRTTTSRRRRSSSSLTAAAARLHVADRGGRPDHVPGPPRSLPDRERGRAVAGQVKRELPPGNLDHPVAGMRRPPRRPRRPGWPHPAGSGGALVLRCFGPSPPAPVGAVLGRGRCWRRWSLLLARRAGGGWTALLGFVHGLGCVAGRHPLDRPHAADFRRHAAGWPSLPPASSPPTSPSSMPPSRSSAGRCGAGPWRSAPPCSPSSAAGAVGGARVAARRALRGVPVEPRRLRLDRPARRAAHRGLDRRLRRRLPPRLRQHRRRAGAGAAGRCVPGAPPACWCPSSCSPSVRAGRGEPVLRHGLWGGRRGGRIPQPVRLLQPNIPNAVTPDWPIIPANNAGCWRCHGRLRPGSLVVWPESAAWPYSYAEDPAFAATDPAAPTAAARCSSTRSCRVVAATTTRPTCCRRRRGDALRQAPAGALRRVRAVRRGLLLRGQAGAQRRRFPARRGADPAPVGRAMLPLPPAPSPALGRPRTESGWARRSATRSSSRGRWPTWCGPGRRCW